MVLALAVVEDLWGQDFEDMVALVKACLWVECSMSRYCLQMDISRCCEDMLW